LSYKDIRLYCLLQGGTLAVAVMHLVRNQPPACPWRPSRAAAES
jgi:hypothetical protein